MASGWIRAFRAVPWNEVLVAAPAAVAGAKKVLTALQKKREADRAASATGAAARPPVDPELTALHQRIVDLETDLVDATRVLDNLADQSARLVAAVEALHRRARSLTWACAALAVVVSSLLVWVSLR